MMIILKMLLNNCRQWTGTLAPSTLSPLDFTPSWLPLHPTFSFFLSMIMSIMLMIVDSWNCLNYIIIFCWCDDDLMIFIHNLDCHCFQFESALHGLTINHKSIFKSVSLSTNMPKVTFSEGKNSDIHRRMFQQHPMLRKYNFDQGWQSGKLYQGN